MFRREFSSCDMPFLGKKVNFFPRQHACGEKFSSLSSWVMKRVQNDLTYQCRIVCTALANFPCRHEPISAEWASLRTVPATGVLCVREWKATGFEGVLENLESPEILLWHFPGLESPGKRPLVLESSGNLLNSTENMKCTEGSKNNYIKILGV